MPSASEMARQLAEAGEPDFASTPTALAVIRGLMEIAEQAMPDTYFATDSRVNAARQWLEENEYARPRT